MKPSTVTASAAYIFFRMSAFNDTMSSSHQNKSNEKKQTLQSVVWFTNPLGFANITMSQAITPAPGLQCFMAMLTR